MGFKVCHSCSVAIQVDENTEAQWNYCNVCGNGLELVPEEEISDKYDIQEE